MREVVGRRGSGGDWVWTGWYDEGEARQ